MSRFDSYDNDDYDAFRAAGWQNAKEKALKGKRGLKVLQEMEQALLALPNPRLIEGYIVKEGEVCAVGAYAKFKNIDLARFEPKINTWGSEDAPDASDTANLGVEAGMQHTIAWMLANLNDEFCAGKTPENRFATILFKVRELIAGNPYYYQEAA